MLHWITTIFWPLIPWAISVHDCIELRFGGPTHSLFKFCSSLIPTVFWPLIGWAVSSHWQTNHWSDWAQIWWSQPLIMGFPLINIVMLYRIPALIPRPHSDLTSSRGLASTDALLFNSSPSGQNGHHFKDNYVLDAFLWMKSFVFWLNFTEVCC